MLVKVQYLQILDRKFMTVFYWNMRGSRGRPRRLRLLRQEPNIWIQKYESIAQTSEHEG